MSDAGHAAAKIEEELAQPRGHLAGDVITLDGELLGEVTFGCGCDDFEQLIDLALQLGCGFLLLLTRERFLAQLVLSGDVGGELDDLVRLAVQVEDGIVAGLDPNLAATLADSLVLVAEVFTGVELLPEVLYTLRWSDRHRLLRRVRGACP